MKRQNKSFKKRYRLTLDFDVNLSEQTLAEDAGAIGDLDEAERQQLVQCERQLIDLLLAKQRDQLDRWSRKYILESVDGGNFDIGAIVKKEELLKQTDEYTAVRLAIKQLPRESSLFLEHMCQDKLFFDELMQDILLAIKVRLVGASLQEKG